MLTYNILSFICWIELKLVVRVDLKNMNDAKFYCVVRVQLD
jgi:hypothetical protein